MLSTKPLILSITLGLRRIAAGPHAVSLRGEKQPTYITLTDHNCEGHARAIFDMLKYEGYLDWIPMELKWFEDVGLSPRTYDGTFRRFCQEHGYLLLTGNRSGDDGDLSLELITRRLVSSESLLVLFISNQKRVLRRPDYCR